MRWPLRNQLLLPLFLLLGGVIGLCTWSALASVQEARHQVETQVRNVGRTLSDASFALNSRILEQMKGLSGADYALLSPQGLQATLPVEPTRLTNEVPVAGDWQQLKLGPPLRFGEYSYLCAGVKLRQPDHTLYILYPEGLWTDAFWHAVRPPLLLGLFIGGASVVLTLALGRRLGRRIRHVADRTTAIAAGDFQPMPLPGGDDELRDLGRAVNDMAERLALLQEKIQQAERFRVLGQVSGGLAHQLRNGVTGARLAVQVHARECAATGDGEALQVALRQLNLVEAGLRRFLDLGRTESKRDDWCSLKSLTEEAYALYEPQCRHAGTEMSWQAPGEDLLVKGDAGQLGRVILNVLGNAVEAAGRGGSVAIMLRAEGKDQALVEIADTGSGPPAELGEKIFEPFVTGKPEGVGLGLAMARQVAQNHGGRISWLREHERTKFQIRLPL